MSSKQILDPDTGRPVKFVHDQNGLGPLGNGAFGLPPTDVTKLGEPVIQFGPTQWGTLSNTAAAAMDLGGRLPLHNMPSVRHLFPNLPDYVTAFAMETLDDQVVPVTTLPQAGAVTMLDKLGWVEALAVEPFVAWCPVGSLVWPVMPAFVVLYKDGRQAAIDVAYSTTSYGRMKQQLLFDIGCQLGFEYQIMCAPPKPGKRKNNRRGRGAK